MFQHLVESMPRRIKAVLKAKGGPNKVASECIILFYYYYNNYRFEELILTNVVNATTFELMELVFYFICHAAEIHFYGFFCSFIF